MLSTMLWWVPYNAELISISNVSFSISFQTVLLRLQNIFYNNLAITSRADRLVEIFGRKEYRLWKWRDGDAIFFFSFFRGRFSETLQRKWTSEIVNVIVKRQLDSNFHGLYSYRPKKWRENVQNFAVKPLACGYIVVLLEFWTYWRHFMVDKSRAYGKIIVVDLSSRFW